LWSDLRERLFGTSGVRGVANVDLTPEFVLKLGLAIANFTASGRVAVGFDTRTSSQMMASSLIGGLLAGGAAVRNYGLIPTPVLAYLTSDTKCHAGTMVTASHNPPKYNGVKLFDGDGMAFNHSLERRIEETMSSGVLKRSDWSHLRVMDSVDCVDRYVEMIKNLVVFERAPKVVVDPGCGAAHSIGPRLFRDQGCEVLAINAQPDGFFPGRSPEPDSESLGVLSSFVKEVGANAGVAYDGDADRMAIVDENGAIVPMDQLIASYGAYLVSSHSESTIVVPVDASMCIEECVEAVGGRVIRTAVGDVNVAEAVLKHKAALGAEASGAWINPDYSLCPDGLLSSMLVLNTVFSEQVNMTLSRFVGLAPKYSILRTKVACPGEHKANVMKKLESELPKIISAESEVLTIDGVRMSSESGWVLVRPSGTEPILRITVEEKDQSRAESLMSDTITYTQNLIKQDSTQ